MKTSEEIKSDVKEKYGKIATGDAEDRKIVSSCCGGGGCGESQAVEMALEYGDSALEGVPEGADLGLGCGTPTAFADLKEGMTVLDLGSGAGIDCFIASKLVGSSGRVIGVDMTDEMIARANENKAKVEVTNVDFRLGEIEALPVADASVDRVLSNCVINLVPDKHAAFREIHRVLKPGGRFTVSDIVADGEMTDTERADASLWAGCISGALNRSDYLGIVRETGFSDIQIVSEKRYDYTLRSGGGLFSITVSAVK